MKFKPIIKNGEGDNLGIEDGQLIVDIIDRSIFVDYGRNRVPVGAVSDVALTRSKGQANGIATLDESGKVPPSQLPSIGASFVYNCNGINDNEILSNMSKDFYNAPITGDGALDNNASLKIVVNGKVGITERPIAGTGAWNNELRYFDFGIPNYSGDRKLYIDWSNATIPQTVFTGGDNCSFIYNNGSFISHEKASINILLRFRFVGRSVAFGGNNTTIFGSTVVIKSESEGVLCTAIGYRGSDNKYFNCTANVTGIVAALDLVVTATCTLIVVGMVMLLGL